MIIEYDQNKGIVCLHQYMTFTVLILRQEVEVLKYEKQFDMILKT